MEKRFSRVVDNRRSAWRVSASVSVDIAGVGGNFAVDIGCGGMRVQSREPVPQGEIELLLHVAQIALPLRGKVVWQRQITPAGKSMAGIAFSPGQETQIEWLLDSLAAHKYDLASPPFVDPSSGETLA